MADIGADAAPVGGQIKSYAKQVAGLNNQIDGLAKAGLPPDAGPQKEGYETLKRQRDALVTRATALVDRAKKAGVNDLDFTGEVKKASQELKAPKQDSAAQTSTQIGALSTSQVGTLSTSGASDADKALLAKVRKQTPAYNDLSDEALLAKMPQLMDGIYKAHYSDIPREQFNEKMGYKPPLPANLGPRNPAGLTEGGREAAEGRLKAVTGPDVSAGNTYEIFKRQEALEKKLIADGKKPEDDPEWQKNARDLARSVSKSNTDMAVGTAALDLTPAGAAIGKAASTAGRKLINPALKIAGKQPLKAAAEEALPESVPARGGAVDPATQGRPDVLDPLARAAGAPMRGAKALASQAKGVEAKKAVEGIRSDVLGRAEGAATDADTQAGAAGKQADSLQSQENRVRADFGERTAKLQKQYEAAGKDTQEAKAAAEQHQTLTSDAKIAVETLDKDLAAKPGISKLEFGKKLLESTRALEEKYTKQRADQSGYSAAVKAAGDKPIVDTSAARATIDEWLKKTNTLSLDPLLERLKAKIATEINGEAHDLLSVPKADSLRKVLDEIARTKVHGDSAVDSETAKAIGAVRDALKASLDNATPALKAARAKWAELSTPLNIVSEKGPLGKVVDIDPRTRDAKLAAAEITGHIIREANAGHPVFARLVAENPELRDSARLYFTQDLFGSGKTPTVGALQTWLKANDNALRQLGLREEFSSIAMAKASAQKAVKDAEGTAKLSAGAAKLSEQREAAALKRLEGMQKRGEDVTKRIQGGKATAEKEKTAATSAAQDYQTFATQLKSAVDKQVPGVTRGALKKLVDDGKIDQKVYKEMLDGVNKAEAEGLKRDALKQRMKNIVYTAGAAIGGYETYRSVRALMGW